MPKLLIYYDPNDATPLGECSQCGGEIYSEEEGEVCFSCREKLGKDDA